MTVPAKQKTWTITANNRIVFVSLNDLSSRYMFGIKAFLKTNGYTVAGSSNGTTGAMDGTDRWTTSANATTRGAASGNAQSWIVLTDSNGVQILITYQGASDDIWRVSFSPGALFTAAGTPQNQPTATDEQIVAGNSMASTTASGDRVWFGWVDSTKKLCRFAASRSGAFTGRMWGVELVASVCSGSGVSWSPAVWGFSLDPSSDSLLNGFQAGVARPSTASTARNATVLWCVEIFGNMSQNDAICNNRPELQLYEGPFMVPLGICSNTASAKGKLGNLYDMWTGRPSFSKDGELPNERNLITVSGLRASPGCMLWPWDGVTTPQLY